MSVNPDKIKAWLDSIAEVDPELATWLATYKITCLPYVGDIRGAQVEVLNYVTVTTTVLGLLGALYPDHEIRFKQSASGGTTPEPSFYVKRSRR